MTLSNIRTIEDLNRACKACKEAQAELGASNTVIRLCAGGGCIASGSLKVEKALIAALEKAGVSERCPVIRTGCMGPCSCGPVIKVNNTFYGPVLEEDVEELVQTHIIDGKIVDRLLARQLNDLNEAKANMETIDFFTRQTKIMLRNCGKIDPGKLEQYLARGGYLGLAKALEMSSQDVIDEVKVSNIRGRGGAGFPTWRKWQFTHDTEADQRYVLCNADEGDPGAFMDRSVLEGDPFSLVEGMTIAAWAIGASEGFVYVRAEYPLAVERLENALAIARKVGLLGDNILGTGFNFNLEIRMGSGAFVCGEETALIASIEGKRGEPRPRPPFPAVKGLWGKPTVLNNVETYANVPAILQKGGAWYAGYGTEKSAGTKVFALAGAIRNAGLVEVPIGTTLGEVIYDIGGGIPDDKPYKAAQIGGPSGGCIPKEHLNVPLDYESLNELGAIMGSGGLIVMDEDSCMVDVARFFMEFVQEESCGKCVPCRVGTKRMLEILERICKGKGEMADLDRLKELGEFIKDGSLCGLGQSAPNPVLSTLRHFRHEYVEHIRDKHCEAGVCPELVRAPCQTACPAHVDVPGFVSLVGEQRYAEALKLHRERNPFASVCARVCFHTCEDKCRRAATDSAVAIRSVKRFMVDQEITIQRPEVVENEQNAARKVAIIGAGPAGLSCAYFLARLGYKPTVFEAEPRPGGMLVQAIPAYRLPREQLAREIRMIEQMGVDIQTNQRLGKDFTLYDLREQGYEAVFLGVGAAKGMTLKLPGSDAEGVVDSLDFLRTYNIRGSVPVGQNVAIIGGGNAAIDAARTAMRLGAEHVTVIYRRTQQEMPAYAEEIEQAMEEGVSLITLASPEEIVVEDGKVKGVKCGKMQLGDFDRSGRRRPVSSEESVLVDADQVIMAVGQELEDSILQTAQTLGCAGEKDWWVQADPTTGQTQVEWLFAGGDDVRGPSSVVWAIADGERAAVGIDQFFNEQSNPEWRKEAVLTLDYDPQADPVPYPREDIPMLEVERRQANFEEVERPWNESIAIRQAKRCLRCDYGKCNSDA